MAEINSHSIQTNNELLLYLPSLKQLQYDLLEGTWSNETFERA